MLHCLPSITWRLQAEMENSAWKQSQHYLYEIKLNRRELYNNPEMNEVTVNRPWVEVAFHSPWEVKTYSQKAAQLLSFIVSLILSYFCLRTCRWKGRSVTLERTALTGEPVSHCDMCLSQCTAIRAAIVFKMCNVSKIPPAWLQSCCWLLALITLFVWQRSCT